MRAVRVGLAGLLLAGIGLFLAGQRAAAATHTVNITDSAYDPATITINAGDKVNWHNAGTTEHDVYFSEDFYSDPVAPGDDTGAVPFTEPGTYAYHCTLNGSFTGSVVVQAPPTTTTTTTTTTVTTPSPTTVPAATSTTKKPTVTTRRTTATTRRTTFHTAAAVTTSTSELTTTTTEFPTTTSEQTTTTSGGEFAIKESKPSNTGAVIGVIIGLAAILGGGGYALWRMWPNRPRY